MPRMSEERSPESPDPAAPRVRRAATPSGSGSVRTLLRERWNQMPPDVVQHACRRVGTVALVFGTIWLIPLLLNNVVYFWLDRLGLVQMPLTDGWPMPGNLVSGIGVVVSFTLFYVARRWCDRRTLLLRLGLVYQVVMAALASYLVHDNPIVRQNGISWSCLIILAYPAIVPSAPRTTLLVSLVVASLDPFFHVLAGLRGEPVSRDAFVLVWQWFPNYVCALLAVVPSAIIAGLGRQVTKARDLGSYRLEERIGRGGMGEVYRARHRFLARPAAIKLIRPELLGTDHTVTRFQREAQAAAVLRSPHTIHLYDFGVTDEGVFYYVMELLDGLDLDTLVRRHGTVSAGRAMFLLRQAARSLAEAHNRGMVHRDVKPSNIFVCRLGLSVDFVKVLDFGLVKERTTPGKETVLVTAPQVTTGTPAYMAPEVALAEGEVDARADIYALACVGFWLLTGRLVFEAESPVKMMLQHVRDIPDPPSRWSEHDVPPELDRLILDCLAKDPAARPATMREVERRIDAIVTNSPWTKARAEEWWDLHHPAAAPYSVLREETPLATIRVEKLEA